MCVGCLVFFFFFFGSFTVFNLVVQQPSKVSPSRGEDFFSQDDKNHGGFSSFGTASGLVQKD